MNRIAIIIAWMVALAGVAEGQSNEGLLTVRGEGSPLELRIVEEAATAALSEVGWRVKSGVLSDKEAKTLLACSPAELASSCAKPVLRKHGAHNLAMFTIARDPHSHELVISGRLLVSGSSRVPVDQRYCQLCSDDRLRANTLALAKTLLDQVMVDDARTILEISTVPSGARCYVDDTLVGVSNKRVAVTPGQHRVRLELPGYVTAYRTAVGSAGTTTEVEAVLDRDPNAAAAPIPQPALSAPSSATPAMRPPRWPVGLMVAGGAAMLGGSLALPFHEAEPEAPLHQEQTRYYTPTMVPGLVAIAAGAAAFGVGYYMWRKPRSAATALVAPGSGGVVVGAAGRF